MQKFDTINVIPFVDIMLVLLAIVLTTATFVQNGELQIALPQARSAVDSQAQEVIEIALDHEGMLYLNARQLVHGNLQQQLNSRDRASLVNLKIDEKSEFSAFVRIVDTLKILGFENISIGTRTSS